MPVLWKALDKSSFASAASTRGAERRKQPVERPLRVEPLEQEADLVQERGGGLGGLAGGGEEGGGAAGQSGGFVAPALFGPQAGEEVAEPGAVQGVGRGLQVAGGALEGGLGAVPVAGEGEGLREVGVGAGQEAGRGSSAGALRVQPADQGEGELEPLAPGGRVGAAGAPAGFQELPGQGRGLEALVPLDRPPPLLRGEGEELGEPPLGLPLPGLLRRLDQLPGPIEDALFEPLPDRIVPRLHGGPQANPAEPAVEEVLQGRAVAPQGREQAGGRGGVRVARVAHSAPPGPGAGSSPTGSPSGSPSARASAASRRARRAATWSGASRPESSRTRTASRGSSHGTCPGSAPSSSTGLTVSAALSWRYISGVRGTCRPLSYRLIRIGSQPIRAANCFWLSRRASRNRARRVAKEVLSCGFVIM